MADNNNMFDIDTDSIHELAAVLKDMQKAAQDINKDMSNSISSMSKFGARARSSVSQVAQSNRQLSLIEKKQMYEMVKRGKDEEARLAKEERQKQVRSTWRTQYRQQRLDEKAAANSERAAEIRAKREALIAKRGKDEEARQRRAQARSDWKAEYRQQRLDAKTYGKSEKAAEIRAKREAILARRAKEEEERQKRIKENTKEWNKGGAIRTAGLGAAVFIFKAAFDELKKQTAELRSLNDKMGGVTGGNTEFIGNSMEAQFSSDVASRARNMLKPTNNAFQGLIDKIKNVSTKFTELSDTMKQAVQIAAQYMTAQTYMQGSQLGISYGQSSRSYIAARMMTLQRMRQLYPNTSDDTLMASEMYETIFKSFIDAMMKGGAVTNTGLSTEGWEGWAFENLGYNPNVDYSEEAKTDARTRYLQELAGLSDQDRAERIKYYKNQERLLKSIAGQLFSFDEVETQQAISMADTMDAVNDFGDDATDELRNQEDLLEELIAKYNLTPLEIANVKRLLEAGLSFKDIDKILFSIRQNGYELRDDVTNSIIDLWKQGYDSSTIAQFIRSLGNASTALDDLADRLRHLGEENDPTVDRVKEAQDARRNEEQRAAREQQQRNQYYQQDSILLSPSQQQQLLDDLHNHNLDSAGRAGTTAAIENGVSGGILSLLGYTGYGTNTNGYATGQRNSSSILGFASGGIGTSKVTGATLFENGPEAVIPLDSDLGKTFMADAIAKANEGATGGDTINVHIDGPVFTENERQLNHWAEQLGDRYVQVKARRGGK